MTEISFDVNAELGRMGLPPYVVQQVAKHLCPYFVVAHISPVYHALPLYIQAGKQASKIIHLVTNPDWIRCDYDFKTRKSKLYLLQGYTFDEKENCYLMVYDNPPIVAYFVNLFPHTAYSDHPSAEFIVGPACDLERYFDGPMCGSDWWDKETNDKILTRLIARGEDVCVPDFIAFVKPPILPNKSHIYSQAIALGEIILLESKSEIETIRDTLTSKLRNITWEGVVVKPSGSRFCGCDGVKFFSTKDVEMIIEYTQSLSKRIAPGEGILVDRRISYKPFEIEDGRKIDCCFRVMLARSIDSHTMRVSGSTEGILGRFSNWGSPVAVCFGGYFETFDYYSRNVHLTDTQKAQLLDGITQLGPKMFCGFQKYEKSRIRDIDEPKLAQIDFVAVDVCVEERGGKLVPVLVEVNDHDSDGHLFLNQLFPNKKGHSFQTWVKTMLTIAELYYKQSIG